MKKNKQPLAEVFGFKIDDMSKDAIRYRKNFLCPFNNKIPNCTKDKAKNPLGVCSIFHNSNAVITCPIRFREDWLITEHAAGFFFKPNAKWSSLTEVRLNDKNGKSAGNIDVVLVAYDDKGKIYDFGALEVQAVYISGNVRSPFERYIKNPLANKSLDWSAEPNYPRPDYLSSSRKRLAPQLIFKGGIVDNWQKKMAVVLNKEFFDTLPPLKRVKKEKAGIAWLVYDLKPDKKQFKLKLIDTVYTEFDAALLAITRSVPGKIESFLKILQEKLDEQMEIEPKNETIKNHFKI